MYKFTMWYKFTIMVYNREEFTIMVYKRECGTSLL